MKINDARIVRAAKSADTVFFVKTSSWPLVRRVKKKSRARLVYDFSDPLWLPQFSKSYPDLDKILATVDAVVCDSRFGQDYVNRVNDATYICRIPSQVELFDEARAHEEPIPSDTRRVTIGWIGSSATAYSLFTILDVLEQIGREHPNVHLRLLGVDEDHPFPRHLENMPCSCLPHYDRNTMIREAMAMDLGLHPVFGNDFGIMHGILKPLVYMASGTAVIASNVGFIPTLVATGENGLLATSGADWHSHLRRLIEDDSLRAELAKRGLAHVRTHNSVDASFADLRAALAL